MTNAAWEAMLHSHAYRDGNAYLKLTWRDPLITPNAHLAEWICTLRGDNPDDEIFGVGITPQEAITDFITTFGKYMLVEDFQ